MPVTLDLADLMDYTEWEREKWHSWLKQQGDDALKIPAGPHGDGRFSAVGDIIKHIFSAEARYIDRLSDRALTDPASIPNDTVDDLFEFGQRSRKDLREFIDAFPSEKWDGMMEFDFLAAYSARRRRKSSLTFCFTKTRHWAQIATLLRLNGLKDELHDFIFTPVLGGDFRRSAAKS